MLTLDTLKDNLEEDVYNNFVSFGREGVEYFVNTFQADQAAIVVDFVTNAGGNGVNAGNFVANAGGNGVNAANFVSGVGGVSVNAGYFVLTAGGENAANFVKNAGGDGVNAFDFFSVDHILPSTRRHEFIKVVGGDLAGNFVAGMERVWVEEDGSTWSCCEASGALDTIEASLTNMDAAKGMAQMAELPLVQAINAIARAKDAERDALLNPVSGYTWVLRET